MPRVFNSPASLCGATILLISLLAVVAQVVWFARTSSITFDETFYANCGLRTVQRGRIDSRLAEYGVAPVPVLLCYVPAGWAVGGESQRHSFSGQVGHLPVVAIARATNAMLAGVGLVAIIYVWLWRRLGPAAAAFGAAVASCSPTVLAHSSVATADGFFATCVLLSLAALVWFRAKRNSPLRFLVLSAAIGLAISAKYSGIFLLPVAGLVMLLDAFNSSRENGIARRYLALAASLGGLLLLVYCSFLFAWAWHGFAFSTPLENLAWPIAQSRHAWVRDLRGVSLPTPLAGILAQVLHNDSGHAAFFLGERSSTGWRAYFPCALLLKSTPVEHLLALALAACAAVAVWRRKLLICLDSTRQVWLCAAAVYLALLVTSRIDIGHRYTLPLYPLLFLGATDIVCPSIALSLRYVALSLRERKRRFSRSETTTLRRPLLLGALAIGLAGAQLLFSLLTGPDKLSYFSPFIGGPKQGYHYLVDSNVDWGQDLPSLKSELDRLGYRHVVLAYFGTARPQDYGLNTMSFRGRAAHEETQLEAIAISVTYLQGVYLSDDPFAEFRGLTPIARAGNSISIFDLRDPRAAAVWQAAREPRAL